MRSQQQKYLFGDGRQFGDCHRTCIAMILNMHRDDVPHFMANLPYGTPADDPLQKECEELERAWLAQRGLAAMTWGYTGETNLGDLLDQNERFHGGPVILGCTSQNRCNHSVIMYKGEIHNPNGGEVLGPMQDGNWYITAIGIGHNWKPRLRDRWKDWFR